MTLPRTSARRGLLLLALLAACDRGPVGADARPPAEGSPADPALARLECTVTVASGAMACAAAAPGTGAAGGLVIGAPNGRYVHLFADGHTYTAADSIFSIDVTVQNLLFQALGTSDGTSADSAGVRVWFAQEPQASVMDPAGPPEEIEIANAQRAMFMVNDQAYFQYGGSLQPNATSEPVQWRFRMSSAVARFTFSVYVAGVVRHPDGVVQVTPPADTMTTGQTVQLASRAVNAVGDSLPDQAVTWQTSDAGVATVSATGLVTPVAPGTATITATQGPRSGATTIAVCPGLAVGGVYAAEMPAGASLCLGAGQYVVVPVNTSQADSTALGVTGAGIIAAAGGPDPARLPGGPRLSLGGGGRLTEDRAWESRLRRTERRELTGRIPPRTPSPAGPGRPRFAITPGVPSVGALMSLNVETDNSCSTPDTRTGRVVAVGTHVIVLADTTNPSGGFTSGDYAAIADSFDAKIHPVVTGAFGAPSDRDGNAGRVIAFYTRAVNELTPPGSPAYVGGFFFSRDLYPAASCPTSNGGEMFYMLVPDPSGTVNGNVREVEFVRQKTLGTLAHEYEHLVNASRRMWVNTPWNGQLEETWLDEGLAHVAEELMFYQASGLAPRTNVDEDVLGTPGLEQTAFLKYGEANFGRLRQWLLAPESNGPFEANDDGLATRGAAWAFLRYAADRRGGTESGFWSALVNTGSTGLANLQAVLGTDPLPWFRDFAGATYADDAGGSPAAAYTHPSWDFRRVYGLLDYGAGPGFPLVPRNPANGVTTSFALVPGGGASYLRMGVPPGGFAGVTVRRAGVAPGSHIRLLVIRRN